MLTANNLAELELISKRQHNEELAAWEREKERKGAEMRAFKAKVEADKAASRQEEADNWREKDLLGSERSALDDEFALFKRDSATLKEGQKQEELREAERRLRR